MLKYLYPCDEAKHLLWDICVGQCRLDFTNKEFLREFYCVPVVYILRIKDSVDMWEKNRGVNGYFEFIEEVIGERISGDELVYILLDYPLLLEAGRRMQKEAKENGKTGGKRTAEE